MQSIFPMMFSNWWEDLEHPHHLPAQHFGMGLGPDRLKTLLRLPLGTGHFYNHPLQTFRDYYRPISAVIQEEPGLSVVNPDKNQFHAALDVQQFAPDEIKVKIIDNYVVVEGKHDEKRDEHGLVTRQFVRKYLVPEQCDINQVTSSLSTDGVLTVIAPRKHQPKVTKTERIINIEHTGKPAIAVEKIPVIHKEETKLETDEILEKSTTEEEIEGLQDDAMKNGDD